MDFEVSQLLIMGKEKLGEDKRENNQERKSAVVFGCDSTHLRPTLGKMLPCPTAFGQFCGNQNVRKRYFKMKFP